MNKTIKNEYDGEEILGNLSKTTVTYEDGSKTIINYRKNIGDESLSSEVVPSAPMAVAGEIGEPFEIERLEKGVEILEVITESNEK